MTYEYTIVVSSCDKQQLIISSRQSMCVLLQVVPSGSKERLAFLARQMDVDILVTGHTHEFKVQCCSICPASANTVT